MSCWAVQKHPLYPDAGSETHIERGSMVPSPPHHLSSECPMTPEQGKQPSFPSERFGMTRIPLLFEGQDIPQAMQFPMLGGKVGAAQQFRMNVPDTHRQILPQQTPERGFAVNGVRPTPHQSFPLTAI